MTFLTLEQFRKLTADLPGDTELWIKGDAPLWHLVKQIDVSTEHTRYIADRAPEDDPRLFVKRTLVRFFD